MEDLKQELLNCPFCGSKGKANSDYFVECSNALCNLSDFDTPTDEWNTRAPSPALQFLQERYNAQEKVLAETTEEVEYYKELAKTRREELLEIKNHE